MPPPPVDDAEKPARPGGFTTDDETARGLLGANLSWYHRFPLSSEVSAPGRSNVTDILALAGVPDNLAGKSVLDIGTIDGGFAFEAERRGSTRVVATEFRDDPRLAFGPVAAAIGSNVEHFRCETYDLPERLLPERFDLVFYRGALYHQRHPLLALEAVHRIAADLVIVETALARRDTGTEFYPDAYRGDPTVWFIPSRQCAVDWFSSCGFTVIDEHVWDQGPHDRGLFTLQVAV